MSLDVYLNCEHCSSSLFSANVTHNLNDMAGEAGIYQHLWRPEEVEIEYAKQLIEPLWNGIKLLRADPDRFKKFNPSNGWGNYDIFVSFVKSYLDACVDNPEAAVNVWR